MNDIKAFIYMVALMLVVSGILGWMRDSTSHSSIPVSSEMFDSEPTFSLF